MTCGGATCVPRRSALPEFSPPLVFQAGTPSLEQLVQQTNRSLRVERLASNTLTIDSPDLAYKLSGTFAWERPHNMRLETKLFSSALGSPLAAGSNSQVFWLQVQRPSPTIYFASHNDFESQNGPRHVLPVSPLWLREAFGIVEMDPAGRHEGPRVRADGRLEVISNIPSPRGDYRRLLIMAAKTGTIEETMLYNQSGKLVAHARLSDHQYYSSIDWSLPHRIAVQLQPDVGPPLTFALDVGLYLVNEAPSSNSSFSFPDTAGLSTVDLVQANAQMQADQSQIHAPLPSIQHNPVVPNPPAYRSAQGDSRNSGWQGYTIR
jgi:hypothetical protein